MNENGNFVLNNDASSKDLNNMEPQRLYKMLYNKSLSTKSLVDLNDEKFQELLEVAQGYEGARPVQAITILSNLVDSKPSCINRLTPDNLIMLLNFDLLNNDSLNELSNEKIIECVSYIQNSGEWSNLGKKFLKKVISLNPQIINNIDAKSLVEIVESGLLNEATLADLSANKILDYIKYVQANETEKKLIMVPKLININREVFNVIEPKLLFEIIDYDIFFAKSAFAKLSKDKFLECVSYVQDPANNYSEDDKKVYLDYIFNPPIINDMDTRELIDIISLGLNIKRFNNLNDAQILACRLYLKNPANNYPEFKQKLILDKLNAIESQKPAPIPNLGNMPRSQEH